MSIGGQRVMEVLRQVAEERGLPGTIRVDNGPEFTSRILDQWAYLNGVELDFSRPGKPTDNAFVESFNGRFRQECLNENWFLSLEDAREKIATWRTHYNGDRPHGALGNLAPLEFAAAGKAAKPAKLTLQLVQVMGASPELQDQRCRWYSNGGKPPRAIRCNAGNWWPIWFELGVGRLTVMRQLRFPIVVAVFVALVIAAVGCAGTEAPEGALDCCECLENRV